RATDQVKDALGVLSVEERPVFFLDRRGVHEFHRRSGLLIWVIDCPQHSLHTDLSYRVIESEVVLDSTCRYDEIAQEIFLHGELRFWRTTYPLRDCIR